MGGLMQLVAYGAQDIYLTGNPQITFFKVVYRRHTNFAIECIEQIFGSSVGAAASSVTSTISRNGDLISGMHLDIKMADQNVTATGGEYLNWINNTGHGYIDEVQVDIGGHQIDKHYGQWLDIYNDLTDHDNKEAALLNRLTAKPTSGYSANNPLQLYVPLKFWFCRNPGLALPIIALQYHDIEIKLKTRGIAGLVASDRVLDIDNSAPSVSLWVDYIFLDTDERRRFAQGSHEYLIEQLQRQSNVASNSQPLYFNHPVKELIWVLQDDTAGTQNTSITSDNVAPNENTTAEGATGDGDFTQRNDYFNYQSNRNDDVEYIGTATSFESFSTCKLELNGHDRFAARKASYFRLMQPLQAGHSIPTKHIYVYSFALKPEEHQPSGSCNFSRIENAKLIFTASQTYSNTSCIVYAVNYNVLRIMSGMGGLAYSN